jgi:dTDP-4-dehydrorhamnose reductase
MRIALIGADGQLGADLMKTLSGQEVADLYYPDFDVTQPEATREQLASIGPQAVINTAAFHRVDECEDRPDQALAVNALAVLNLARVCRDLGCALVHFSTDYVFDGRKGRPYLEEDAPNPLMVYGVTKLAGEYFVRDTLERHFLIRTCGLYGLAGCKEKGGHFVDMIIRRESQGLPLRVVADQRVTPTSTAELARAVAELVQTEHYGLYHLTNEGECSWYEFARAIFDLLGRRPTLEAVDSSAYGSKARRPRYSVLENGKAKRVGLGPLSPWREALADYLQAKGYSVPGRG